MTTGRKSPGLLIKEATSETVNRLGADRQDKWCGSMCSSPSLPLSLCLDGPGRNKTPVIESIAVNINTENPQRFLWGLPDCWLLTGWRSHQAEIRLMCFFLPNFRLWKRQQSLFFFSPTVTSNALQIWKKSPPTSPLSLSFSLSLPACLLLSYLSYCPHGWPQEKISCQRSHPRLSQSNYKPGYFFTSAKHIAHWYCMTSSSSHLPPPPEDNSGKYTHAALRSSPGGQGEKLLRNSQVKPGEILPLIVLWN